MGMFEYMRLRAPSAGGGITHVMRPTLWVGVRAPGSMPWASGTAMARAVGMIDSGAFATSAPM